MEPVYGPDRVRRLRMVLGVLAVLALGSCGVAGYALIAVVPDEPERTTYVVALALISGTLLVSTCLTWWKLPTATRGVHRATMACGGLALVVAFLTSALPVGFLLALVGLGSLFLGLASEQPVDQQ